jgi:hypothetical protein
MFLINHIHPKETPKIIVLWNEMHYCVYVWNCWAYWFVNLFNPVTWIQCIPQVKSWYKKNGLIVWYAGNFMGSLIMLLIASLLNVLQGIFQVRFFSISMPRHFTLIDIILGAFVIIVTGVLNHKALFTKDRYLRFFTRLERSTKSYKIKMHITAVAVIMAIIAILLWSFFKFLVPVKYPVTDLIKISTSCKCEC